MKWLYIIILLCLVSACSPSKSEYQKLMSEKQSLEREVKDLKDSLNKAISELDGYRFSPEKLCSNIDELYKNGNLSELQSIRDKLMKYHPESKEVKEVKALCDKIVENQKQKIEAEKKQRMQAVNKLRKKYDDVSGITWYYNPYFVHYNNSNHASIYMGQKDGDVWLRLVMSYTGDDWIFFENAYLSYDGNTKQIYFDEYRDKETDNDTRVWEWIDVSVDSSLLSFLKEMVNGKEVKMRLSGKYTKTRNLSSSEIKGFKDVLLGYDVLLKGK